MVEGPARRAGSSRSCGSTAPIHLRHLAKAARLAGKEMPAIAEKFTVPPATLPYASFRTAAGAVGAEAEGNADLLWKYGLAEPVFASRGRRAHVGPAPTSTTWRPRWSPWSA